MFALSRIASSLALDIEATSFTEDTFSLMMISKVNSQSWVLGVVSMHILHLNSYVSFLQSLT